MLKSSVLVPPSPNWFQPQMLASQPSLELVAYAGHNSIVLLCTRTQQIVRTMCGGPSRVTSLCFAPTTVAPHHLVAGHEDGTLRSWDTNSGSTVRSHRKKGAEATAVLVLEGHKEGLALVGNAKGDLLLWAFLESAKPVKIDSAAFGPNRVCAMSALPAPPGSELSGTPTPSLVLVASHDGCVSMVDVDRGCLCFVLAAHRGPVHALSVTLGPPHATSSAAPPPGGDAQRHKQSEEDPGEPDRGSAQQAALGRGALGAAPDMIAGVGGDAGGGDAERVGVVQEDEKDLAGSEDGGADVLMLTASGDEGCVKVWRFPHGAVGFPPSLAASIVLPQQQQQQQQGGGRGRGR
ncbi:WD40-repeat-containing domain protein, partial [Dunaliella salina]